SLALLCFLGAGHTHEAGEFRPQVKAGLEYLIRNMEVSEFGGDLRGGFTSQGMYVQGLAAIVLCEALAMTNEAPPQVSAGRASDPPPAASEERRRDTLPLREAAQQAVGFIAWAQHSEGGWRYAPKQRGDTSVVGWQVMALESARSARIRIAPGTLARVSQFLNRVQIERGARYGYDSPRREGSATSAVGLLCRMYLGWRRDHPALARGIQHLSRRGPDRNDMYHNYYATQVLHHWGGDEWQAWNAVMRDGLVHAQDTEGHAKGSWPPTGSLGAIHGGRLYQTTLSIMTLEVYYRHLPLYRARNLDAETPQLSPESQSPAN
ncbi:MAG TPA: hypothetical protein VML55_07365, partial [Planctomycetaceae bacterium]|nr:hypothetical protein [Planctomycetaceae bacterium]